MDCLFQNLGYRSIDIGRKFSTRSESPDLNIGLTLADFHKAGTVLDLFDKFIICARGFAITVAQSFSKFGGRSSIPVALLHFASMIGVLSQQRL